MQSHMICRNVTYGAVLLCVHVILVHSKTLQIATAVNYQQCQRLCWYRATCVAYSIPYDVSLTDSDVTCLLHMAPLPDGEAPTGWRTQAATSQGIQHACRVRRCDTTQTCVPVGHSLTEYKCLSLPIDCDTPLHPSNGIFTVHGTGVGQVASLSCDQHFVVVPRNAATQIMCTGSAGWTTLDVSCHQVVFPQSPAVPFTGKLPWPMSAGWEACVRGTFLGGGHMVFNFLSNEYNFLNMNIDDYPEVIVQLSFRDKFGTKKQAMNINEKRNFTWSELATVPGMPLTAKDHFVITLRLSSSHLTAVLHSSTTFTASFAWVDRVELLSTAYLAIGRNVKLDYVHLVSAQGCF